MDLAGDEKRIRALFFELSLADKQSAPRFEKLWREAQRAQPVPRFNKSLVVIAATSLIAVAVLFAAWSAYKSPAAQNAQTVTPQTITTPEAPEVREPEKAVVVRRRPRWEPTRRRSVARRQQQSERALHQQAAMLASWKSPTDNFMTSPTRAAFNSLPQLNESVKELQSFLPKESNQ